MIGLRGIFFSSFVPILILLYIVHYYFSWLAFLLALWIALSFLSACCWARIFGDWSEDE